MSQDIELPDHDDALMRRARTRILRAIATARAQDRYNRTHCHITLAQAGRGVAHNPACAPWPIRGVQWSGQAREALNPSPFPTPELLWSSKNPTEIPLVVPAWARDKIPGLAEALDAGYELRRNAGLKDGR